MSSEFSPELRRELLDDFYAECDELLTGIREGLGQLETLREAGQADDKVTEGLFRNTHSLKGISSIVGLRSVEQLAHAMEDVLRAVTHGSLEVTPTLVDHLLDAVQRIEAAVTAHRLAKPIPETGNILDALAGYIPLRANGQPEAAETEPAAAPSLGDPAAEALRKGLIPAKATFTPSAERDKRGVNITSVRERLGAVGEILAAVPRVMGKGQIEFEFAMGLKEAPVDVEVWERDGIIFALSKLRAPESTSAAPVPIDVSATVSLTPSHIVRVDLAKLDELMRIAGQLVIQRSQLEERLQRHNAARDDLKEVNVGIGRSLKELREAITRVRMVPIAELFARMPFVVRDLARSSEKKARVVLEGHSTEVDKYIVERLKEPLLHLVRNAFAHGIETAAARVAVGKAPEATITLRAQIAGESVVIAVADDGRGVDGAAVASKAKAAGVPVPDHLDAAALAGILCTPGFSTRAEADMAAGRGVGMAVVAATVRELGGTLKLETTLGSGTEFILKLPLTLSIADAIIVNVAAETFAVPQSAVDELFQVAATEVRTIKKVELVPYRSGLLPLVRLRKAFGTPQSDSPLVSVLVVSTERGSAGLVVDRIRGQREIVVRPLTDPLLRVAGISGATELGDGRPILILDPANITNGVVRPMEVSTSAEAAG